MVVIPVEGRSPRPPTVEQDAPTRPVPVKGTHLPLYPRELRTVSEGKGTGGTVTTARPCASWVQVPVGPSTVHNKQTSFTIHDLLVHGYSVEEFGAVVTVKPDGRVIVKHVEEQARDAIHSAVNSTELTMTDTEDGVVVAAPDEWDGPSEYRWEATRLTIDPKHVTIIKEPSLENGPRFGVVVFGISGDPVRLGELTFGRVIRNSVHLDEVDMDNVANVVARHRELDR